MSSNSLRPLAVVLCAGFMAGLAGCANEEYRPMATRSSKEFLVKTRAPAGEMPRIGDVAPSFHADTTLGPVDFPGAYEGQWVVLFSHPGDFTPVCTTEMMGFATALRDFKAVNCELLGLSVDGKPSHIAWVLEMEKYKVRGMENVIVGFPIIADKGMAVARKYGMIHPNSSDTSTVRAVFIIDPKSVVRAILYYPATTGRSIPEILRTVVALQTADKQVCSTPVNWQPGEDVIIPPAGTCNAAAKRLTEADRAKLDCQAWYLCFKKMPKSKLTLPPSMK